MPDLTEEQATKKLDEVVEAVLWNDGEFMWALEFLARSCYSPTPGYEEKEDEVHLRMTRLWYAYVRSQLPDEESECDCDVRKPSVPWR